MPQQMSIRMRLYLTSVMVCGLGVIAFTASQLKGVNVAHFAGLLCAAALASRLSLKIPRLNASLSLDVPFVILAAVQMGLSAAVVVAAVSTFVQCFKAGLNKSAVVKLMFNVSALSIAAAVAAVSVTLFSMAGLRFGVAGAMLLAVNSVIVAFVVSMDGHGKAPKIWWQLLSWSFPAYVLGAGMASMLTLSQPVMGWYVPVLSLPIMVGVYQSYRRYFGSAALTLQGGVIVKTEVEQEVTM